MVIGIVKNGFEFFSGHIDTYNSLAWVSLPTGQTTAEFSGSWTIENRVFNKFKVEFSIYVEKESSKWIYMNYFKYQYIADDGYTIRGTQWSNPSETYDDYYLILFFNIDGAFDLSKLTLTSPDRLDAKGTYYINWQTYQFQNNGEQLIRDAIKPEFADKKDYIMQTYGLILRAFRILDKKEWLPGDTEKFNFSILDKNITSNLWKPITDPDQLVLTNRRAFIDYSGGDM